MSHNDASRESRDIRAALACTREQRAKYGRLGKLEMILNLSTSLTICHTDLTMYRHLRIGPVVKTMHSMYGS